MSYTRSQVVAVADFNALAGLTGTAASSSSAATAIAGYLYGIGYGDRGYGQTSPALTAASAHNAATSWANLQAVLSNLAAWQNTSTTKLPSSAQMSSGAPIVAYPTGATLSLPDLLSLLDTNRLNYQVGNMGLTSGATDTRSTTWNTGPIVSTLKATWTTEDNTRFFFNTGGQIRFSLTHSPNSISQDQNWHSLIDGLSIAMSANGSTVLTDSADGGTATSVGFYQLTTSYQTIWTGAGTGAYSANTAVIQARSTAITGANGGNGATVQITVSLTDAHAGTYDTVSAGTTSNMSYLAAAAGLGTLPSTPSVTVVTAFG